MLTYWGSSSGGCALRPPCMKGHDSGLGVSQPPSPMGRQKHPPGEGVVNAGSGPIRAGGTFPHEWLSRHLKSKEMYLLYHMLRQVLYKAARRRAGLDQRRQERTTQRPETHGLLVHLFDLTVVFGFLLTVNWIRTASNDIADAFSRPSREAIFAPRRLSDGVERAGPA